MAVTSACLYCLYLLVIVFFESFCQQSSHDLRKSEDGLHFKSFQDDIGAGPDIVYENNTALEDKKLDSVLGLLEQLQHQVDELQSNIQTMCSPDNFRQTRPMVLKIVEKANCPQSAPFTGPKYEIHNCGKGTSNQKNFFLVDGTNPIFVENEIFCSVFSPLRLTEKQYSVRAELYNLNALYGSYYGFPGIAFNVEDGNNYDFVIIRIHDSGGCYRTGYVQNGQLSYIGSKSGLCPAGDIRGRSWFSVEVQVNDDNAVLLIKNMQATTFQPHFPNQPRGGVIVKLGESNVIRFRGLTIKPVFKNLFDIINCQSFYRISAHYYRLDSRGGQWPEGEFCKAIYKKKLTSKDYSVSVQLFNQRGSHGTHLSGTLGLMFNAKDENNYDFIYFSPESKYGCYYTGFVQNSIIKWSDSKVGSCAGGSFKGGQWNHISLNVRDDRLMVFLGGRHLLTTNSHFQSRAAAGVIVANSNSGNVISFMDFEVQPISPSIFKTYGCNTETRMVNDYYLLDAKHGQWPDDTFCRAFIKEALPGNNYMISAEMFISEKRTDKNFKEYYGLAFNIRDKLNYDFVFVRPKETFCYYVGYVRNQKIKYISKLDGECKGGPPNKGSWFQMSLSLRDGIAMIDLDGKHLVTSSPHFETRARGGIIVANGFKNMVTVRNFKAAIIDPLPMQLSRCGSKTHIANDTIVLHGAYPYWPIHLFCSALYKKSLDTETDIYTVGAMLYNVESYTGSYWGQPGVMFNSLNIYTYEYVYLRIHNKANCYQFGSVKAGRIMERRSDSGSCLSMRPQQNEWFHLTVKVMKTGEVHLIIDNVFIAKHKTHLSWIPTGGVLVPNGFKNIIMARNFTLS